LASAALLAALVTPCAAQNLPSERVKWLRVETPNFTLYGDAGEGKMREVGLEFERLHGHLAQARPAGRMNSPVPTSVYVFSGRRSMEPYLPLDEKGKPRNLDGFFYGSPDANYIVLSAAWNKDPRRLVYHEYLHYYMRSNFPPQPLWYDEGLAEFFSSFRATGKEAHIGLPVEDHVLLLRTTGLMPLEQLFEISQDSPEYNEDFRTGIVYAQSWALVHMLMRGEPDRREAFGKFLLMVQNGQPAATAFRVAFGMTPPQMLEELAAYIRGSRFFYARVPLSTGVQTVVPRVSPMPYDETLARLGDLLAQSTVRGVDAEAHLRAALERNPASVPALTALAAMRMGKGRDEEARELLRRAVATGRSDFRTDYEHGRGLMSTLSGESLEQLSPEQRRTLEEARTAFRSSVRKNPEFAEARVALGRTFLGERGDAVAEGIVAMEEAARRLPTRSDVLYELSRLYEAKGDETKAEEILKKAVGTEAAAALKRKRSGPSLEDTVEKVNGLLAQGKEDEAVALYEEFVAAAAAAPPETRAILEEELRKLKAGAARNRVVKEFNEAVALANRQDYAAALERFERVAASPDAKSEIAAAAREQAERLRAHLARLPKKTPRKS
jgi:tetratricopeptide (TPR) repeat protein